MNSTNETKLLEAVKQAYSDYTNRANSPYVNPDAFLVAFKAGHDFATSSKRD